MDCGNISIQMEVLKKPFHYFNDSLVCNLDVEDFDFY